MSKDFIIPEDLSDFGKQIAKRIIDVADNSIDPICGGGYRAFYSPESWRKRGEEYGKGAELIVVHDGGDLAPYFNHDYDCYPAVEEMDKALSRLGAYAEQCTSWYTAIYLD